MEIQRSKSGSAQGRYLVGSDVSVLILTLDEEKNIEWCLRAVSWSDDIVVFDSFSGDRTAEIAKYFGSP